jgi:hypothetical protein
MAHFKWGRVKNQRSGCLYCKYWKSNGLKDSAFIRRPVEQRAAGHLDASEAYFDDGLYD